jgi:hypothetical protein
LNNTATLSILIVEIKKCLLIHQNRLVIIAGNKKNFNEQEIK